MIGLALVDGARHLPALPALALGVRHQLEVGEHLLAGHALLREARVGRKTPAVGLQRPFQIGQRVIAHVLLLVPRFRRA